MIVSAHYLTKAVVLSCHARTHPSKGPTPDFKAMSMGITSSKYPRHISTFRMSAVLPAHHRSCPPSNSTHRQLLSVCKPFLRPRSLHLVRPMDLRHRPHIQNMEAKLDQCRTGCSRICRQHPLMVPRVSSSPLSQGYRMACIPQLNIRKAP